MQYCKILHWEYSTLAKTTRSANERKKKTRHCDMSCITNEIWLTHKLMFEYKLFRSRSFIIILFLPVVLKLHAFHFVVSARSIIPLSFHCCDEISPCRGRHGRNTQGNHREDEPNTHCQQRLHGFPWISSTKNSFFFHSSTPVKNTCRANLKAESALGDHALSSRKQLWLSV